MRSTLARSAFLLLTVAMLGGMAVAIASPSSPAAEEDVQLLGAGGVKPGSEQFIKTLVGDFVSSGFEVTRGHPRLWTMDDCEYTYAAALNCYANNPASPYVLAAVKPWPEEFVEPAAADVYGKTRRGYSSTFRLDPREALVIFGQMPPPGRYMGLQSYMFSHEWVIEEGDPVHPWGYPWVTDAQRGGRDRFVNSPMVQYLFSTLPRQEKRVQSFSSLGNSINNVVMDQGPSGASFGAVRYFVITPDQAMEQGVRDALDRLGVSDEDVFTEPIAQRFARAGSATGGEIGPLGLGREAPDFMTGLRYAMPADEQAADAWRARLPLTVLRVRESPASPRAARPYEGIVADQRKAEDESGLQEDLGALVAAVTARAAGGPWNLGVLEAPSMGQSPFMGNVETWLGHFGPQCRSIGMNCLGDGQDASYFFMPPQPLDGGQVYAVIGTLGTKTGNATYSALSVNDASVLKGVGNVPDTDPRSPDRALEGSANGYAGTVANTDKFFVHFFTRDCGPLEGLTGGACTTITERMVPHMTDVRASGDPHLHGFFTAGLRSYVKPGTARGPVTRYKLDPAKGQLVYDSGQLPPVVLSFTPSAP
jgi:hypothetical protein